MIVFLNPASRGGKGGASWGKLEPLLGERGINVKTLIPRASAEIGESVEAEYARGEREFVAAGGDGSVNALLNGLMTALPEGARRTVALGAIGLGSSNDFHKPFSEAGTIEGVPAKINFPLAALRDVGVLELEERGETLTRYFLVNASVGLTADANRFFNSPDALLSFLKRTSTPFAIAYAAVSTILRFSNRFFGIRTETGLRRDVALTNLNILKSPHVSGTLTYPLPPTYDNGLLQCVLASSMGIVGRLRLLRLLSRGRVPVTPMLETFGCSVLTVTSASPFAVEFDGEIAVTSEVKFSVLQQHLRVCTC
jgi:diacylglycerol kinase family enzyme